VGAQISLSQATRFPRNCDIKHTRHAEARLLNVGDLGYNCDIPKRKAKMSIPTITIGEAISLINNSILDFQDGLSQDTIEKIVYAINNEIQVRDYMLGIPETYSLATAVEFVKYLVSSVDEEDIVALATIASAYEYENENYLTSATLLNKVKQLNPTYFLANLLDRVFEANWPADSFAGMRKQLHPQVIAKLEEMKDQLI